MFQDETGLGQHQGRVTRSYVIRTVKIGLSVGLLALAALSARAQSADDFRTESAIEVGDKYDILAVDSFAQSSPGHFSIDVKADTATTVDLLHWVKHRDNLEKPKEKYNRRLQFGKWRRIARDGSCLDSRGLVLQRESQEQISTRPSAIGCSVVTGRWVDPYNGEIIESAEKMAIDHFVPLKNAYDNGAWKWSMNKRCSYFNYQKNNYHLQAVGERENAVKGDAGPDRYMPPLRRVQCGYLKNWLVIKASWDLTMSIEEGEAIREHVRQAGCDEKEFAMKETELKRIRSEIKAGAESCEFAANPNAQPFLTDAPEFVDAGAGI